MAIPEKYVTLQRGEDFVVKTGLGETRELRLCVVPGRLAIDLFMAAGNEDPQTVVALAAGLPVEELDWIDAFELKRLQDAVLDLNFEVCAAVAEDRAIAAKRMLPVLRKAGKTAIDEALEAVLKDMEKSLTSKLPSLKSTTGQEPSSGKIPSTSLIPNLSQGSSTESPMPESGPNGEPS